MARYLPSTTQAYADFPQEMIDTFLEFGNMVLASLNYNTRVEFRENSFVSVPLPDQVNNAEDDGQGLDAGNVADGQGLDAGNIADGQGLDAGNVADGQGLDAGNVAGGQGLDVGDGDDADAEGEMLNAGLNAGNVAEEAIAWNFSQLDFLCVLSSLLCELKPTMANPVRLDEFDARCRERLPPFAGEFNWESIVATFNRLPVFSDYPSVLTIDGNELFITED